MRKMLWLTLVVVANAGVHAGEVSTSVLDTTDLPSTEAAPVRLAIRVPLGELPEGARIDELRLEGVLAGIPEDGSFWIQATAITGNWSSEEVAGTPPATDSKLSAYWEVSPLDYERTGRFVRLDLTGLARDWRAGTATNHGVVLEAGGISSESLRSGLGQLQIVLLFSQ